MLICSGGPTSGATRGCARDAPGIAAVQLRITDAGHAQILAEMSCGGLLDRRRIAQRAERVVQVEQKRQPLLVRPQFGFRLPVLERRPGPIGDVLNQGELVGRPHAWGAAVHAEGAHEPAVFNEQRAGIRADVHSLQRGALLGGVRPAGRVSDRQRPAFQDVCHTAADQIAPQQVAGERRDTIHVIVDDHAVVVLNLGIDHPADMEVCSEEATGLFKNPPRIGERPDGVAQASQEGLPTLAPAQCLFGTGPLGCGPRAVGSDFHQCDLVAGPGPRRGAVDAQAREPSTILDERRPDERGRIGGKQLVAAPHP